MSVLVVGTMGIDSVETPFGRVDEVLGGSATYASLAASFFTQPKMVSVIGTDFPEDYIKILRKKNIDVEGIQKISGKTFRWTGIYKDDLNVANTLKTELNVLEEFKAIVPKSYRDTKYVLLGNIDPELQLKVIKQMTNPKLIIGDTMNFWIAYKRNELLKTLKKLHVLVINDSEARQLANEPNLVKAAGIIRKMGPKILIIKKGEHGALMFSEKTLFASSAYPLEEIFDPTGAGDCFAGGFIGYLAKNEDISERSMRRAIVHGSVIASFNVEDFSVNKLIKIKANDIVKRFKDFRKFSHFDDI
ncbi:MAG: sugar kinase [Candidatus Firestonebacteria bacterium]|nr:sugar kinase [Candidatus Firestonebacteria bacterium]